MVKKDIVNYLYYNHGGFSRKECQWIVDVFFDFLKSGLKEDRKVTLSKFGTFYVKKYEGRKIYHPITKKEIKIESHHTVSFRKSKS